MGCAIWHHPIRIAASGCASPRSIRARESDREHGHGRSCKFRDRRRTRSLACVGPGVSHVRWDVKQGMSLANADRAETSERRWRFPARRGARIGLIEPSSTPLAPRLDSYITPAPAFLSLHPSRLPASTMSVSSRVQWSASLDPTKAQVPTEETKFHRKVSAAIGLCPSCHND